MRPTATELATVSRECIDNRSQFATRNNSHGDNRRTRDGKAAYGFAIMHTPLALISARLSSNPDAPRLHPQHRDFLHYLWSCGGAMRQIDEYTVEVEVDPQYGNGRDEYAALVGKNPSTIGRWARDLKAHGLIDTRKTRLVDRNPAGQGRTVWIVRLPINAVEQRHRIGRARVNDDVARRHELREARRSGAPAKPREKDYRQRRQNAAAHTVQEPTSDPKMRGATGAPRAHRAIETPRAHRAIDTPRMRGGVRTQEQIAITPIPRTAAATREATIDDRLALRVLTERIGVSPNVAADLVRQLGGELCCAYGHCHLEGNPSGGAGAFVNKAREGKHGAFEYSRGGRRIRPTGEGDLIVDSNDGSNPPTRRQKTEDRRRLADGGALRTCALVA
jgi:hypothetical protein